MKKLVKYVAVAALFCGLSGCDQSQENDSHRHSSLTSSSQASLFAGKLKFPLPPGFSDQTQKLHRESPDLHVYANGAGDRSIIVMATAATATPLEVLGERLVAQQRQLDPQLQLVVNKTATLSGQPVQQIDSVISAHQVTNWSSVVMVKLNQQLITMQVSLPAEDQAAAQAEAAQIIAGISFN